MKQVVTMKTIAKELNVSTATVSKALQDSYEISQDTKDKVRALAKALNYELNPAGSSLRGQKTKTIAIIVPDVANNFFSLAIKGIEEIARQLNYHVLIYQTHENCEVEIAFTNSLLNGRVDGILISVASDSNNSEHFKALVNKIPIVFFDRVYENIDAVKIITDDYESTYKATQHLIDCGCKKIAYLSALDTLTTGKLRSAGYADALTKNNVSLSENLILVNSNDDAKNYEHIKQLLLTQRPDGIVSSIEDLAIPCYYVCRELKISIPDDLKIISFSNLKTAPLLNPSLTTIKQPAFEMGKQAANILFQILRNKHTGPNENLIMKSDLIIRESTSCG